MNTKDKTKKETDLSKVLPEDPEKDPTIFNILDVRKKDTPLPPSIEKGAIWETEQDFEEDDGAWEEVPLPDVPPPGDQRLFSDESATDEEEQEDQQLVEPDSEDEQTPIAEDQQDQIALGTSRQTGTDSVSELQGSKLKLIMEALLFSSGQPVSLDRIASVLKEGQRKQIKTAMEELIREYQEREGALEIVEVAGGYQVRTRSEYASWVMKLRQQRVMRLSRAALETLAIVAYRQPVTRAEVESIRGVDTGAVLGNLLERRQVRILGRKEVPGRPIIYGTTREFLELFGLKSLKDLPTLREIEAMLPAVQIEEDATSSAETEASEQALKAEEQALEQDISDLESESVEVDEQEEIEEEKFEEEISTRELDDILKQTKTKLEHFQEEHVEPSAEDGTGRIDAEASREVSDAGEAEGAEETNRE